MQRCSHLKIFLAVLLMLNALNLPVHGQDTQIQVRAAWLTTLNNIDWPSKPGLSEKELKQELNTILNFYYQTGINTIFFQVRPTAEVFYQSSLEPWNRAITGNKGQTPPGNFDPLLYLLKEGHKRGMEIHAWINPFRVLFNPTKQELKEFLSYQENSDWYVKYGNHLYLDPGVPEVRNYVLEVVKDLVNNYDVDGIHLDDYFYPYPKNNKPFDDAETFKKYGDRDDIGSWRRTNINDFVFRIHQYLNSDHPYIKFGISPFGVWENADAHPAGSDTQASITSYSTNYADVLYWMQEGWIDYLIPQLYWNIGFELADFAKLTEWWNQHSYGRHIYVGHANYKFDRKSPIPSWREPEEIVRQFKNIEQYQNLVGSAFFNTSTLMKNPVSSTDSLRAYLHRYPSKIPMMDYKSQVEPSPIQQLKCREQNNQVIVFWKLARQTNPNFTYTFYLSSEDSPEEKHLKLVIPGHISSATLPQEWFTEGQEYRVFIGATSKTHCEKLYEETVLVSFKKGKIQCKMDEIDLTIE